MALLHLLSYAAAVVAFIFITLSLASGLLWLSEVIEEHSRNAKLIGTRGIYAIIALHVLLYWTDSLPLPKVLFSVLCHVVYLQNFSRTWPLISLTSPSFVASCALVIVDHFIWFFHFAQLTNDSRLRASRAYRGPKPAPAGVPSFGDMATFFGVCVWLAPLFLFLSLSANDNALPTASDVLNSPTTPGQPTPPTRTPLLRSLIDALPLDYLPRLRPRAHRRASEGLIAPHTPTRRASSPIPSPASPTPTLNNLPRSPSYDRPDGAVRARLTPDFQLSPPPARKATLSSSLGAPPSLSRRR